jgi:HAD domain in Swiss Army Knife RNA repair proteins
MEKIIFLDVDGVMISSETSSTALRDYFQQDPPKYFAPNYSKQIAERVVFDSEAMWVIEQLIDVTGAKVVFHSDWTMYPASRDLLKEAMKRSGFKEEWLHNQWCLFVQAQILGTNMAVPGNQWSHRWEKRYWRVPCWLAENTKTKHFIILDDEPFDAWDDYQVEAPEDILGRRPAIWRQFPWFGVQQWDGSKNQGVAHPQALRIKGRDGYHALQKADFENARLLLDQEYVVPPLLYPNAT